MKPFNMYENKTKGRLITFCGLDGSGKTTMLNRLNTYLEKNYDYDVFITKQPTSAVRNSEIFRTYMDSPNHSEYEYRSLSLLAASDRIQHTKKVIEPAMMDGKIVLSDRYLYSCLSNLRARGYKNDQWIYEISSSIIKPDIAFFFDVQVDEAISRVRQRPEEKDRYIDKDLQYELRREYVDICNINNGILISTSMSEDDCFKIVKESVEKIL